VFKREFMQIGHIDVFVESITIASACNTVIAQTVSEARHYRTYSDGRVHL